MRTFLLTTLIIILLVAPMAYAIGFDDPEGTSPVAPEKGNVSTAASPAANPAPTVSAPKNYSDNKSEKTISGWQQPQTTQKVVVKEVVRIVPAPHPTTLSGHHIGAGHEAVYQEVKSWNPASSSAVEAKVSKETKARKTADSAISNRVKALEGDNGNNYILLFAIFGSIFVIGIATVTAIAIAEN